MPGMKPNPKGKVTPTPTPVAKAPKPAAKTPGLPSLAEYKQSAAYKTGAMSYKDYIDYFKSRGAK